MRLALTAAAAISICTLSAVAQGTKADYDRAAKLQSQTRDKIFKSSVRPNWAADGKSFWYRNALPDGREEFFRVDVTIGERKKIDKPDSKSTQPKLLSEARPSSRTGPETSITFINNRRTPVTIYWNDTEGRRQSYGEIAPGQTRQQHTFAGHVWIVADAAGSPLVIAEATEAPLQLAIDNTARQRPQAPQTGPRRRMRSTSVANSPDGKFRAFIEANNLWIEETAIKTKAALTKDGGESDAYVADFHWSPDGKRFVVRKIKKGKPRTIHTVESSPRSQLQPILHSQRYDKPGDELDMAFVHLFDIPAKKEIPIARDLCPTPWSVDEIRWEPDSKRFTFLYNQRGHQVLRIIAVDGETGKTTAVVDEVSKTFIDYAAKKFSQYLDDTGEIIWMSERSGWNHLYLYDARSGRVKNPITQGDWVVRGVDRVDPKKREIWFRASGIDAGQDPYYIHFCRANFDGTHLVRLTDGDGNHRVEYSPNGEYLIDTWSRVDLPPVSELRRSSDGKKICDLERADWSKLLATGWKAPERFVAKARDGKTDIYGVIWRPTNFDASRKYPVIEQIYAGPQGSFVPKEFASYYRPQAIAELGFVVVQIDGMGTSNRSKAFHDVSCKNLADAGFADRILWMKAAAAKYPYLDLSRVGIYGGSAGGQNALGGLLFHPEFYKAGVADCGCHDNRMDKVWWNELWMGWPIGPHYAAQSNVTNAHKLQGKLLLIVGELDQNVDPATTMQVVNALIKADKDFDLLVVPGGGHGIGESLYGSRRRMDFFVRHLLKVEPRGG